MNLVSFSFINEMKVKHPICWIARSLIFLCWPCSSISCISTPTKSSQSPWSYHFVPPKDNMRVFKYRTNYIFQSSSSICMPMARHHHCLGQRCLVHESDRQNLKLTDQHGVLVLGIGHVFCQQADIMFQLSGNQSGFSSMTGSHFWLVRLESFV